MPLVDLVNSLCSKVIGTIATEIKQRLLGLTVLLKLLGNKIDNTTLCFQREKWIKMIWRGFPIGWNLAEHFVVFLLWKLMSNNIYVAVNGFCVDFVPLYCVCAGGGGMERSGLPQIWTEITHHLSIRRPKRLKRKAEMNVEFQKPPKLTWLGQRVGIGVVQGWILKHWQQFHFEDLSKHKRFCLARKVPVQKLGFGTKEWRWGARSELATCFGPAARETFRIVWFDMVIKGCHGVAVPHGVWWWCLGGTS